MKQIRKSVFETNSSSMHSLVIQNEDIFDSSDSSSMYEDPTETIKSNLRKNGKCRFWGEEWYFGRHPFRILDTFEEKFKYAYANEYKENDLLPIIQKYVPECIGIEWPKHYGTDDQRLPSWLNKLNVSLEEFLTNRRYIVICDGDEYYIWEDMKESGIIKTSNFKEMR